MTFLFISHSLREVFELCDDLTILRDGEVVASGAAKEFTEVDLIEKMSAARAAGEEAPEKRLRENAPSRRGSEVVLRARGVTIRPTVRDVDLTLHEGEWVGLTGLVGSGAVALASSFAGFGRFHEGTVEIGGRKLTPGEPTRPSTSASVSCRPTGTGTVWSTRCRSGATSRSPRCAGCRRSASSMSGRSGAVRWLRSSEWGS